jgi:nitrate reductase delta subunit
MTNLTLKVLSALLCYPTRELQDAGPEMIALLNADRLLSARRRAEIIALVTHVTGGDLFDRQADYVDLFDRTRALSLHLFEHVHGESRDRGQAMVSLLERYRQAGLDVSANELPDYLPLFLEFLAQRPSAEAGAMLGDTAHILSALAERLKKRGSNYAVLFEALGDIAATRPDPDALAELNKVPLDDPTDLAALDRAWEEAEVRFGPGDAGNDGCPRADEMVRRMGTSVPGKGAQA